MELEETRTEPTREKTAKRELFRKFSKGKDLKYSRSSVREKFFPFFTPSFSPLCFFPFLPPPPCFSTRSPSFCSTNLPPTQCRRILRQVKKIVNDLPRNNRQFDREQFHRSLTIGRRRIKPRSVLFHPVPLSSSSCCSFLFCFQRFDDVIGRSFAAEEFSSTPDQVAKACH